MPPEDRRRLRSGRTGHPDKSVGSGRSRRGESELWIVVKVVKVSSRSSPHAVAGALAGILRESGTVEVQVIGAGALNQAVKSIAVARSFLADSGQDAACRPTFATVEVNGEARTAIRLLVEVQVQTLAESRARPPTALASVSALAGP